MNPKLNGQMVREKALDVVVVLRTVLDQMTLKDATPEGSAARELVEKGLSSAILRTSALNLDDQQLQRMCRLEVKLAGEMTLAEAKEMSKAFQLAESAVEEIISRLSNGRNG